MFCHAGFKFRHGLCSEGDRGTNAGIGRGRDGGTSVADTVAGRTGGDRRAGRGGYILAQWALCGYGRFGYGRDFIYSYRENGGFYRRT